MIPEPNWVIAYWSRIVFGIALIGVLVAWAVRYWERRQAVVWAVGGLLTLGLAGFVIWPLPEWLVPELADAAPQVRVTLVNEVRRTWVNVAGGVIAVGALVIALWRSHIAHRSVLATELGQITESFTRAIEQLGAVKGDKPNVEVRIGGIYALEQIALDAPNRYYRQIMEVLCAYVRGNNRFDEYPVRNRDEQEAAAGAPAKSVPPDAPPRRLDVQAALTVIGRRDRANDGRHGLDLSGTDLRGYDLSRARLQRAYLREAHLESANLAGAHLEGANLSEAHMEDANLNFAHLEAANLTLAHLEGAHLWGAHLEGANLTSADLTGANLWGTHLEGANLSNAHLGGAELLEPHLEDALRPEDDIPGWKADAESRLHRIADNRQDRD